MDSISYSRWQCYETCPQQYKFRYIDKLPQVARSYFAFGHAVHATLEAFVRPQLQRPNPPDPMTLNELLQHYDRVWEREGYDSWAQEQEYYRKGQEMLGAFHAKYMLERPVPILVEQDLRVRVHGIELHGIIDRIDLVHDSALAIRDYKTTKRMTQRDADESDQLAVYQILAEQTYNLPVAELSLYHLVSNTDLVSEPRTPEQLQAVTTRLVAAVDAVRRNEFAPKTGPYCGRCDFKQICPAWR